LGQTLKAAGIFPPFVYNQIMIGEETGNLGTVLGNIADFYDKDCEEYTKTFTTLLEPAMVLVIGVVVGFIVMAILLPIMRLDFIRM
ncbi:MAG: type II secretion system F family protein, partial [Candidatus Omnitrophota bacterium]